MIKKIVSNIFIYFYTVFFFPVKMCVLTNWDHIAYDFDTCF